tara:strand:- start:217 stop:468 length:252 start_codon:yes stop_codon:yes gene_type:complete
MPDINVEADLTTVNDQIVKLVDDLNKINANREQLIQQVQNLNGVAMYLRGKLQTSEEVAPSVLTEETEENDLGRYSEYPEPTS